MATETIGIVSNLEDRPYKDVKRLWALLKRKYDCVAYEQYGHPHVSFQAANSSDIRQLKKSLQTLAAQIEPFEIEAGGIMHFNRKVICLEVRKTERLIQIHQRINQFLQSRCRGLFEYYLPAKWIPHITLAQEAPTIESFEKAWRELKNSKLRFRQRLHNMCMVKWCPDGRIRIAKRYKL
jgi:2'-5' RNA ligase